MKRDKVSGIGNRLKEIIDSSNKTLKDISKETKLSIKLLEDFIKSRKEPFAIPEMNQILFAIRTEENKEEIAEFYEEWIRKSAEVNKL